jgi:hypothetical protein
MSLSAITGLRLRQDEMLNRVVYCLLLPLIVLVLGAQALFPGTARDVARTSRRSLWVEAQSQASIAASYVIWASSLLHSSERRTRPERLS